MNKSEYKVLARRYRPQVFGSVIGQDSIVATLKNAIKFNKIAHAYLFCGSRGTGKTTLARIFAKALNCLNLSEDQEPCNQCSACREISSGSSLDVLEIDGASNRGIDDIRQINETVGYATASGTYKIYIIDEVHMLTKEAFNALLKTLEEPPAKVKFLFATTEPHKVLPTILSRCQRFNLNRISPEKIVEKLRHIVKDLNITADEEALRLVAQMAEGGLRDAESLLDQVASFQEGTITVEATASILGVMPKECFFELDKAGMRGDLNKAFEIAELVFSQGKDLSHFLDGLIEHYRTILLMKLGGKNASFLSLMPHEREGYEESAKGYSQEQCVNIIEWLLEAQQKIRFASSPRVSLESLLMRVIRIHQWISIDLLVKRLAELESRLGDSSGPVKEEIKVVLPAELPKSAPKSEEKIVVSMTVDPTPTPADLGVKQVKVRQPEPIVNPAPVELGSRPTPEAKNVDIKRKSKYDTLLHFTAVELEGTIKKKQYNRV